MITKQFKAFLQAILQYSGSSWAGYVEAKSAIGQTVYLVSRLNTSNSIFPYSIGSTVQLASNYSGSGIYLGTGDTAPTENDYMMESLITSGLTAGSIVEALGMDSSGNPYKEMIFTLTNTTASDITVKEIGYVQSLYATSAQGGTSSTASRFLFDRTVLSTPVTVPANNGTAAIKYTLKTIIS